MNDSVSFVIKVIVLSAALSFLIKLGGPLLPLSSPYTADLDGLVIVCVILPSLLLGAGLTILSIYAKRSV